MGKTHDLSIYAAVTFLLIATALYVFVVASRLGTIDAKLNAICEAVQCEEHTDG